MSDADAVFHVVSPLDEGDIEASMIVPMRVLVAAFDAGVSRFVYLSRTALDIVLHLPSVNRTCCVKASRWGGE